MSVVANSTAQPFSAALSDLASGTTYYFRTVFHDTTSSSYSYGAIRSFETLPPVVTTFAATSITSSATTLNGRVNPQGSAGKAYFQWGTSSTLATSTSTTLVAVTANTTPQTFSASLSDLPSNTTYYFRMAFEDTNNTTYTYGAISSFKTLQPVVITQAATSITSSGAYLNGEINPESSPGNIVIQYGTSSTLATHSSFSAAVTDNMSAQSYAFIATGLDSGTKYYFRIAFQNTSNGTYTYGSILNFTTSP
jgi:phosphodiesterase/alkaline phosphatase D-like protein